MPIAVEVFAIQILLSLIGNFPWLVELFMAKAEQLKEDPDRIRKAAQALLEMPLSDEVLARYGISRNAAKAPKTILDEEVR